MCLQLLILRFFFFYHKHVYSLNLIEKTDASMWASVNIISFCSANVINLVRRDHLEAFNMRGLAARQEWQMPGDSGHFKKKKKSNPNHHKQETR